MTFDEWWLSEERNLDWHERMIAKSAWTAAVSVERERGAKLCECAIEARPGFCFSEECATRIRDA